MYDSQPAILRSLSSVAAAYAAFATAAAEAPGTSQHVGMAVVWSFGILFLSERQGQETNSFVM